MDANKNYRIALVIKTDGLEYDDRIRKEILSIQELFPNVKVKIYVNLDDDNRDSEGVTSYGVPFRTVRVPSRDKYPSATHLLRKTVDFYRVIGKEVEEYDAVWCGEISVAAFVALCKNKRLIWDLHELPAKFMGRSYSKYALRWLFHKCRLVVHANPQRLEYLYNHGYIKDKSKHFAIRNFPKFGDIQSEIDEMVEKFDKWRDGRRCLYLQGLERNERSAYETISAVLQIEGVAAVVAGRFNEEILTRLKADWKKEFDKRIYLLGKVPQLTIPQYMNHCFASMVFYKNTCPNNYYCEANRFYQSVIMGLPVVVGNNPPMKEFVDRYGFGICIDDDGSDVEKIKGGLERLLQDYEELKGNCIEHRSSLTWEQQNDIFKEIIPKLLA